MTDTFASAELTALQQRFDELRARLARAVEQGRTAGSGRDPSGAIEVILGDDGTAREIRVTSDWRRHLAPEEVGPAIVAADADAAQRRAEATAAAFASTSDPGSDATPANEPVPAGRTRQLSELVDQALTTFDELDRVTVAPGGTGSGGAGAVTVSLSHGRITGCALDARWLGNQDATTLARELRHALASATAAQTAANRPVAAFSQLITDLLADVTATLRDVGRGYA
jgi:hypothetical protein